MDGGSLVKIQDEAVYEYMAEELGKKMANALQVDVVFVRRDGRLWRCRGQISFWPKSPWSEFDRSACHLPRAEMLLKA